MEYFGILVVIAVLGIGYWVYTDTNNSTPVVETKPTPKATKISRPVLNKLTKDDPRVNFIYDKLKEINKSL